jgi:signal transduction histidine kinase
MEPLGSIDASRGGDGQPFRAASETVAVLPVYAIDALAHQARDVEAALELYCGLIEEPGVLAPTYLHYGSELRQVRAACGRIVELLAALDPLEIPDANHRSVSEEPKQNPGAGMPPLAQARPMNLLRADRIGNLAGEVESKRNLLSALAGPAIALTLDIQGGTLPVNLARGELTRVLVNLVKNAVEAMPSGGKIAVNLDEFHAADPEAAWLVLTVEDSGPGFAPERIGRIFEPARIGTLNGLGRGSPRTPGLRICREIVEAAGGRIHADNRPGSGARVGIELPAAGP